MRSRCRYIWRVAVAIILVVMAVAPAVAISGATADYVPPRPETYMDPIPAYMDSTLVGATPWMMGTSIWGQEGRPVVSVEVQIQRDSDGYCWLDGTGWVTDTDTWNPCDGFGAEAWTTDQWWWTHTGTITAGDLDSPGSYTVKARAVDDGGLVDGWVDLTPAVRKFSYDDADPDVSFSTVFPGTIYSLPSIQGTASDDDGLVDHSRIMIQNTDTGDYWNGHFWQANAVWIKTEGIANWEIDSTTNPPLPQWQNNVNYAVQARTVDRANNQDTEPAVPPGHAFLYRHKLTSASAYVNPLPEYANAATDFVVGGFTGTSKATGGHNIVDVRVQIRDNTDNVWWNDNLLVWQTGTVTWADCPGAALTPMPAFGQVDWNCPIPGGVALVNGHTYQISARATDDTVPTALTYTSPTRSFTYDNSAPGSNIDAFDVIVYNSWNSMTGNSSDTDGEVGSVVVLIQDTTITGDYWNGAGWGPDQWGSAAPTGEWDWIFATPTDGSFDEPIELWRVTTATNPDLPPLINDVAYHIEVRSFDKAGNVEATAIKDFDFHVDMEVGVGFKTPTPTYTYVPGPTSTGGPTTPPTTAPTTPPTTAPTTPPTTAPTTAPTTPPTEPTATPTTVPGFSGSNSVGSAGGTVMAKDGDGVTRVTAAFESGALSSTQTISIEGSGTCTGTAPEGYIFGNSCFDITPSQALGAKVKICVYYTSADLMAAGGDVNNLRLAYKQSDGTWKVLKTTVDTSAGTVCAETDHLSSWAVVGKSEGAEEGLLWWHYLLIGLGALLVVLVIVFVMMRPRGEGGEYEEYEYGEEGYEEE